MDLNRAIANSMAPTPAEQANKAALMALGTQYDLVATPILNPSPEQQVALSQVNAPVPRPRFHYDETRQLPERTWTMGDYTLEYQNGAYRFTQAVKQPVLWVFSRTEQRPLAQAPDATRMMSLIQSDRSLSPADKRYFTAVITAHQDTHAETRRTKSPLGRTMQEVHTTTDMTTSVDPSGLVLGDVHGTGYAWGNTVDALPDF